MDAAGSSVAIPHQHVIQLSPVRGVVDLVPYESCEHEMMHLQTPRTIANQAAKPKK